MRCRIIAMPGIFLVCALAMLLGYGPEDEGNAPSATTTEEGANVAEAAASGIDESSIRMHLAHLTGVSPAPLESGEVAIPERGSVDGRRAAAEYVALSFEEMGIPARILEFSSDYGRGYNVEATLHGTGGEKVAGAGFEPATFGL